jgi:ubiquinone/menaquinone biosynthesis C-methylase UbiE
VAELLSGRRVLEIACGTGYWTAAIAPVVASLTATDASEDVLEIARRKDLPPGRVAFGVADAYRPDEIPGSFDAVLAAFWWSHVPARRRGAFQDALERRLPSGGRVVLLDNRYVEGSSTPSATRTATPGSCGDWTTGASTGCSRTFPSRRACWRCRERGRRGSC